MQVEHVEFRPPNDSLLVAETTLEARVQKGLVVRARRNAQLCLWYDPSELKRSPEMERKYHMITD
jgi:hypothetical protein